MELLEILLMGFTTCVALFFGVIYTKTKKYKVFKYISMLLQVLFSLFVVFMIFWIAIFSLWEYADSQRNKANKYIQIHEGFNALKAYKHSLYIMGGQIDGCGWYYPISEIYAFGLGDVPQNDDNALYWYKRYGDFYLTSFMPVDDGCGFDAWYLFAVSKCYAGVDCEDLYMRDILQNVKPNSEKTLIWLNHAADFGIEKAMIIQQKCQIKNIISKNESVIFACVRNEMLELQNSK